jgi:hypothetical protein
LGNKEEPEIAIVVEYEESQVDTNNALAASPYGIRSSD